MKNLRTKSTAMLLAIGYGMLLATQAAPGNPSSTTDVTRSVFLIPSEPKEGRDPFFPGSTRPYKSMAPASSRSDEVSSLVIKGFSGSVDHRLVIINNHTFAPGDEGDVVTAGGRIHLSCVEIRTNSVVIEVGGERHELFYIDRP